MTKSYLMGGKLGDFIHSLAVCKYIYDISGVKADLFIANIGDSFEQPVEFTFSELKPVLEKQEWLNSFNLYDGREIEVNLSNFRNSNHLYAGHNWLNVYFKTFIPGENPPKEFKWIDMERDERYTNALIVNRSISKPGGLPADALQGYQNIANQYDEKYFVCFEKFQYEAFPLKDQFQILLVKDLYEYFKVINSAKLFVGNQSGPFAWASAMNVPRVLEILRVPEGIWYRSDSDYYKNFSLI
jgi:hypothetical protein